MCKEGKGVSTLLNTCQSCISVGWLLIIILGMSMYILSMQYNHIEQLGRLLCKATYYIYIDILFDIIIVTNMACLQIKALH